MKKLAAIWFALALTAVAGTVVINTFNAGELSSYMDARVDFGKYRSGCRTMENFIPLQYGGAARRPGTQYITATYSNLPARLMPMSIGADQSYVLELGENYIRFLADGAQLVDTNSEPLEVWSPYGTNDLFEVQTSQSGDVMYFTHPDYPVWKLTRTSTDPSFTFERVQWDYPPLLEENDTETEISVLVTNLTVVSFKHGGGLKYILSGGRNGKNKYVRESYPTYEGYYWDSTNWVFWSGENENTIGFRSTNDVENPTLATNWTRLIAWSWNIVKNWSEVTTNETTVYDGRVGYAYFNASSNIWTSNHIGSVWSISHPRTNNFIYFNSITASATSDAIRVEGTWKLLTQETWDGKLIIQISEDGQETWTDYREYVSAGAGANYDRDGEETESGVYYRLVYKKIGGTLTASLKNEDEYQDCLFEITGYTSPTQVLGRIYTDYPLSATNATTLWAEGAFSDERGHPRACELYENRLWLAGTGHEVNSLWASRTDEYDDFEIGVYDDSGMKFTLDSDNMIEWMLGQNALFLGTFGGEWVLSGGDANTALTPTAAMARQQSSYGSKAGMDALSVEDAKLYLQRQGRKLRNLEYSFEADQYKSADLTVLAEHITDGGIVQMSGQQQPYPVIWCVRADGTLVGMTYSREQNVAAWHRHITDGEFESVAVIPTDGEDRVYVIVKRTVNGETRRYIEWFRLFDWGSDDDAWFVDSGLDFDGGDAAAVTAMTNDTNGYVTVAAANSFSDGENITFVNMTDDLWLDDVFSVTNATATNFVLASVGGDEKYIYTNALTATGYVQRVENTFTNVSHLAGMMLDIFADGGVQPQAAVDTNGVLIIADYKNRVIAGIPYTSRISPMILDVYGEGGSSYGMSKQPYRVRFRVKDSGRFQYGTDTNDLFYISVRDPELPAGSPVPFYTGDTLEYTLQSGYSTQPEIWVLSGEPLPLTIQSMVIYLDIKDIQ